MKQQVGLVRKCMLSAFLSSVAWAVPGMQALASDLPVKAPAAVEPIPYWWFHGTVEVGGRFSSMILSAMARLTLASRAWPSFTNIATFDRGRSV